MNRVRQLDGVNSYARELGFHPLDAAGRAGWTYAAAAASAGAGRDGARAAGARGAGGHRRGRPGGRLLRGTAAQLHEASIVQLDAGADVRPDHVPARAALRRGQARGAEPRRVGWHRGGRLVAGPRPGPVRVPDGRLLRRQLRARSGSATTPRRRRIGRVGPGTVDLPYVYLARRPGRTQLTPPAAVDSYYEAGTPETAGEGGPSYSDGLGALDRFVGADWDGDPISPTARLTFR